MHTHTHTHTVAVMSVTVSPLFFLNCARNGFRGNLTPDSSMSGVSGGVARGIKLTDRHWLSEAAAMRGRAEARAASRNAISSSLMISTGILFLAADSMRDLANLEVDPRLISPSLFLSRLVPPRARNLVVWLTRSRFVCEANWIGLDSIDRLDREGNRRSTALAFKFFLFFWFCFVFSGPN